MLAQQTMKSYFSLSGKEAMNTEYLLNNNAVFIKILFRNNNNNRTTKKN